MQVTVESGEGLERRLKVEVPAERVNEQVDKRLQEIAQTARLDGFRPGKVPLRVVRQRFGQQVRQEAYGELVQSTFFEAASKESLKPAGEPKIEFDEAEGDTFRYTAIFEVVPEIELVDISSTRIMRPLVEITDADVDAMIAKLRKQRVTWNEVERAAQDGDTVNMNFKGLIDGEAFDGGTAENVPLVLGSGNMIDGFESGLLGAKKGEDRTLELKFPEDYRAEHLAGKDAVFEIKVNSVSEPVEPEMNEEFVKAFGVEDGTEASLRAEIRKNMGRELKQKLRSVLKDRAMDAVLEAHSVDVPRAMVTEEAARLKQQTIEDMRRTGQGNTLDFPVSMFEPQAERRVKLGLLIGEIIRKENLAVDQDRVKDTIAEFAESYEDPQEVVDFYSSDREQRAGVENIVLEEQVVEWVLEQASVEDEPKAFDDLMGQQ